MLVRLIGQEKAALEGNWTTPFRDVPAWAAPYVGYAYAKGLIQWNQPHPIFPQSSISASEYLTFVLRALGYDSSTDFAWDSAWTLSDKLGITKGSYNAATTAFDRGDVAWISASALSAKGKGSDTTLEAMLADQGIRYDAGRCLWEEDCVTSQKDRIVFSFSPTEESQEAYTSFQVTSATANGLPVRLRNTRPPLRSRRSASRLAARRAPPSPCPTPSAWFLWAMTSPPPSRRPRKWSPLTNFPTP